MKRNGLITTVLNPAPATVPSPPSPPQTHPALQLQNPAASSVALEFEQFHKMTTIMEVT